MSTRGGRILIVGAGAVGAVYGHFLQEGGADVTFYVRPAYVSDVTDGLALYPLNKRGARRSPVRLLPDAVLSSPEEVADAEAFDQIWVCVSATALRSGFIRALADATAGKAKQTPTWVLLTPGLEDREYLAGFVESEAVVQGVITMISYAAPLPGSAESVPEAGIAFYIPPGSSQPLSGERGRAQIVARSLADGGCKAKVVADVGATGALGSAVMMPYLLALEAASWRFDVLKANGAVKALAAEAGREATAVVAAEQRERSGGQEGRRGIGDGLVERLMGQANRPWLLTIVLTLGPRLLPLDLEAYLAYHFTKVGDQTRYMVERYIALGREQGRSTAALQEMLALVPALGEPDDGDQPLT